MTDIPEDIREAARKAADEHDDRMRKTYLAGAPDRHAAMVEIVAQALLSERMRERMRCAEIADRSASEHWDNGARCASESIASAIRSGE